MKRFLSILFVVLAAMTLFVGCNAEVSSNTTLDDLDMSKFTAKTMVLHGKLWEIIKG